MKNVGVWDEKQKLGGTIKPELTPLPVGVEHFRDPTRLK
jgi:hypothetical protein